MIRKKEKRKGDNDDKKGVEEKVEIMMIMIIVSRDLLMFSLNLPLLYKRVALVKL